MKIKNNCYLLLLKIKLIIKSYNDLFGKSIEGISRTLSRVYVKKLFRKPTNDNDIKILKDEFSENNSRRWGGGLESI